jgi:hypothetical protein
MAVYKMGPGYIVEVGKSPKLDAQASVIRGTITLQSNFKNATACLVGMDTCSLATGVQAGSVSVTKQTFVAPNKIEVVAELPGVGNIGGRDLYSAEFNYTIAGEIA